MPFKSKALHKSGPDGMWREDELLAYGRKKGVLKQAEFPNAAGPEDWDALAGSPTKKDQPQNKEKASQGYDLDGDGSHLMPDLRRIHKIGHVIPVEKLAQGEFEYADLGPNAGDMGPRVTWKMPKFKRAAGLDQEENLDDQQRGTEPPAAFPQPPDIRLQQMAKERGPLKKIARSSYVAFLDELERLGHLADYYMGKEAP